jgi:hypothetical protein
MALAHAVGDKVEAAYRRDDLFANWRQLADAWAKILRRCEWRRRQGGPDPPRGGRMIIPIDI